MNNAINNRWISVITLLLLTANIITLTMLWINKTAKEKPVDGPPPGKQVFEFITNELRLDTVQQNSYKKLREAHQEGIRPLQDSIRMAKDRFFELLKEENTAETKIQDYSKRIGELEQQRDIITFKHFQKLRLICNKEQQIKFDSILKAVMRRMGSQGRPGRPPGPPPAGSDNGDRRPPPPGAEGEERMPPPVQ